MMLMRVMIIVISLSFTTNHFASAQIVKRSDRGAIQFTDAIVGKWEIDKIVVSGRVASENFGPSAFTTDTWTIQSKNGDRVYRLSSINESSDPLEATFDPIKATFDESAGNPLSFIAFIQLDNDKLTIVRGIGLKNPIPLPKRMEEGPSTVAYTFRKVAEDQSVITDAGVPLNVRLIDDANDSKVLVDATLKPLLGGKIVYSSERRGAFEKHENSPRTGTVISGKIIPAGDGRWTVLLIIEIGNQEHSENAETTIIRSEKLQINTVLSADKTIRIKCSGNRTCELTLK